jgi:transcriptional regulator with XRE-family HTH domain
MKTQNQDRFRIELRRYRKNHGISQAELACAAGMLQSAIGNFETGVFNLSENSMSRVQTALLRLIEERAAGASAASASFRRCLSPRRDTGGSLWCRRVGL